VAGLPRLALRSLSETLIRAAGADDVLFLERMLCWAGNWRSEEVDELVLAEPGVRRYVEAWGRPGDFALIAEKAAGERVGAAWYRLFGAHEGSYGFVDETTPEVTVGVERAHRGAGIGRALLLTLADSAREDGYSRLSLSVEEDNPSLRLYERVGFKRVSQRHGAWTLVLSLL
jgi:ribosomal protein S18 acetylase RimI-like enzyme